MISKTTLSPWKKTGGDLLPRDTAEEIGIGLNADVLGSLDIDSGDNRWCLLEIEMNNNADVMLGDILPSGTGLIWLFGTDRQNPTTANFIFGCQSLEGLQEDTTTAYDLNSNIEDYDVGAGGTASLCIVPTTGGGYYMVNRLDQLLILTIMYVGAGG